MTDREPPLPAAALARVRPWVERRIAQVTAALLPDEQLAWRDLRGLLEELGAKVRGRGGAQKRAAAEGRIHAARMLLTRADRVRAQADGREARMQADTARRLRAAMG